MKNTTKILLVVAAIVIVVILFLKFSPYSQKDSGETPPEALAEVRAKDSQVLEEGTESDVEIAKSLLRYTEQNLENTEAYVQKYLEHENTLIRAAAIEAYGGLSNPDFNVFKKAIEDENADIRMSAIRALAKNQSEVGHQILVSHTKNKMNDNEKSELYLALMKSTAVPEDKAKYRDFLLAQLASGEINNYEKILQSLYAYLPRDEKLMAWALQDLKDATKSDTSALSLPYLLAYNKAAVNDNAFEFIFFENPTYQETFVGYLKDNCPKLKVQIIQNSMQSSTMNSNVKKQLEDILKNNTCKN